MATLKDLVRTRRRLAKNYISTTAEHLEKWTAAGSEGDTIEVRVNGLPVDIYEINADGSRRKLVP